MKTIQRKHHGAVRSAPLGMLAGLAAWAGGWAVGQTITDNFDDGNDTGWTRLVPLQVVGGSAAFSFAGGNSYRIIAAAAPPSPPAPPGIGPARAGAFRADVSYTAFRIEVDVLNWNDALNQDLGIIARVSSPGLGTLNGYAWSYETGNQTAYLSRLDGEAPTVLGESVVPLTTGESYRFVLEGFGGDFCGQIFRADTPEFSLVSVIRFDATYESGFGGVFNNSVPDDGTTDTTFDNYRSSTETDVDKDGMTDQWEIDHFGELFWFAEEDFDGDRQSNLEEFIGGSDPADPGSLSGIRTVAVTGGNLVVTFPQVAGRSYALETSINLDAWDPQPGAVLTDLGATASLSLPTGGQTPLFARVVVTVE